MTLHSSLALLAAMFVFALIPGPGVMALVGRTLSRGMRSGLVWAAGEIAGDFSYLMLAIYGLGYIASELSGVFLVIRVLGGVYLIWLGLSCLFGRGDIPSPEVVPLAHGRREDARGFMGGLCLSLGNPKVIAFYCGFLPTFMDMATLTTSDVALVSVLIVGMGYAVLAGYVLAAASGRRLFARTGFWKKFRRGAGVLMVGTGAAVIAE